MEFRNLRTWVTKGVSSIVYDDKKKFTFNVFLFFTFNIAVL